MAEQIICLLGFTDPIGIFWNILAYIGMIMIMVAVVSPRCQKQFFVWGPLALMAYAWFYLHNPVLTGLQLVVSTSGALNLLNVKKSAPFVIAGLTVAVFAALLLAGQLSGLWLLIGAFGLLGIAVGLTQLPRKRGYVAMAIGGLLIVVYALALQIWVFLVLNAVFFASNLFALRKFKKKQ